MKRHIIGMSMLLAVANLSWADVGNMKRILAEWDSKMEEWNAAYEFAKPENREGLLKTRPDPAAMVKPLWKETESILDKPESLPAVIWLLNHTSAIAAAYDATNSAKIVKALLDTIDTSLINVPGVGKAAPVLSQSSNLRCREILEHMHEANKNPVDQGLAAMGLVLSMREKNSMRQDDPRLKSIRLAYLREAIIKCFDEPFGEWGRVSDLTKEALYDLNKISIRCDGPAFELPSGSGSMASIPNRKPALLVFWNPSYAQSAQFVAQAEKLKNSYPDLDIVPIANSKAEAAQLAIQEAGITASCLFDEKGEVFRLYRIGRVPAVYLLDEEGVIRLRGIPDMMFQVVFEQAMNKIVDAKQKSTKDPKTGKGQKPASVQPKSAGKQHNGGSESLAPQGDSKKNDMIAPPPLRPLPES